MPAAHPLASVLRDRLNSQPFNGWATAIFLAAVIHTLLTHKIRHWAHFLDRRRSDTNDASRTKSVRPLVRVLHFLGETEVVFGIWVIPLLIVMALQQGLSRANDYLDGIRYHEALFVTIIMIISSTKPVLRLAEQAVNLFSRALGGGVPGAWLAILAAGPLLGSFITEPAAMTICAGLLSRRFYQLRPSTRLAYATLGLLFVNISVGGVLTNFAAPPVVMIASRWRWSSWYILVHFGWVAIVATIVSTICYFAAFRRELRAIAPNNEGIKTASSKSIPVWVTTGHIVAMAWCVWQAHHPVMLIGGFLFFLAFTEVAGDHREPLSLRPAILVGFFLGGLVIHAGLQEWWISAVLERLSPVALLLGSTALTAFNDNAAITYLASLVPGLGTAAKHSVLVGAIAGGGLTVIANAPNPAGQSILGKYFPDGVSPFGLFLGALPATVIALIAFLAARGV